MPISALLISKANRRRAAAMSVSRSSLLPYVLALLVFSGASCGVRAGDIVLVPNGFRGWVIVRYEVPDAPPLGREGFKTVIRVPLSGYLFTRSGRSAGYGVDEYYFEDAAGKRTRMQLESGGCAERDSPCAQQFVFSMGSVTATTFFVGTKSDLGRYPRPTVP